MAAEVIDDDDVYKLDDDDYAIRLVQNTSAILLPLLV
jgi:hypothetical protein